MNPLLKYSLARIGFFVVPFVVFVLIGFDMVTSALFATGVALILSLVALRTLRAAASAHLGTLGKRAGQGDYDQDMAIEDRIADDNTGR